MAMMHALSAHCSQLLILNHVKQALRMVEATLFEGLIT